jgi:CheY-like chemotaxis protein/HPt (histidine-containing phosphotransfer) domain-containing protein
MINREQLLKIPELKLTGKIEQMDEGKLNNFVQLLNSFTDNLTEIKKKINNALIARDYDTLAKHLSTVRDMLGKIYAEEIAQDCTKQINWLGSEKHEKVEAYMRYFLSSLTILSTDIQKAQKQLDDSDAAQKNAADIDKETENIIVGKLLDISDLKIDEKIKQMGDDELLNYLQILNTFIDTFPLYEDKINDALKTKNNDALIKNLTEIKDILEKIHADEMAQDCTKQINTIGSTSPEKVEAYMRYFLSTLSMLSIDIQMAQQKTSAITAIPEKKDEAFKADAKILAVDDTAFFLTILKKILQSTRYKLTCVSSGRDALKYLEKSQPDIFLLDIEMPGMDGYELATRIKESGQKAPIIFLTGNAKKEYLAKALKVGAVDFIIKPINQEVLLSKIRKYLR